MIEREVVTERHSIVVREAGDSERAPIVSHQELADGGTIEIDMGSKPSRIRIEFTGKSGEPITLSEVELLG